MEIIDRPPTAKVPSSTFTGDVWVDAIYTGGLDQARLAVVRFAPGARSHWHSHRLGQTLHVDEGVALLGSCDSTVIEANPGDTIYTAPGEEHWHGAAGDWFMAHLALMEGDGDETPQTVWAEAVADAAYQAPRIRTR